MFKNCLVFILLLSSMLYAQSIDECMDCHGDKDFSKSINDSLELSLYIDLNAYQRSVHGEMECVDCHSSIKDVEHEEDLPNVNCADCHEDAEAEYSQSIHASKERYENVILAG